MVEIGYLAVAQRFYQKFVANVSIYNQNTYRQTNCLDTEHFVSAFLLWGIGVTVSLFIFGVEIIYAKRKVKVGAITECNF